MGSVKDLIINLMIAEQLGVLEHLRRPAVELYSAPTMIDFGRGTWYVGGTFSVADLKDLIPSVVIKNKPEGLAMMTAMAFEYLANRHPDISMCYEGLMDNNGKVVDAITLLDRGEISNLIVMKLAHVPQTVFPDVTDKDEQLRQYRESLADGTLQCCVADVESIFRNGFPLGSSTFEKMFKAVGMGKEYQTMATYDEVVAGLDRVRSIVREESGNLPELRKVLEKAGLEVVPNPGYILDKFVYNTTSKFEAAGDRDLSSEEERAFSGLSEVGYEIWRKVYVPLTAATQIELSKERNVVNIDGKEECVAFHKMPVLTDFICTPDENRLMFLYNHEGEDLLIPSNKEIQRAIFRQEGVYAAKAESIEIARGKVNASEWKSYMPAVLKNRKIDLQAVTEHSCNLMSYAFAEVANRMLGQTVFNTTPLDQWVPQFVPYASRVQSK